MALPIAIGCKNNALLNNVLLTVADKQTLGVGTNLLAHHVVSLGSCSLVSGVHFVDTCSCNGR